MSEFMVSALVTTATVAILSLFVVSLIGIPAAYLVSGMRPAVRRWVDVALISPMVLPPTVLGFGLLMVFGTKGVLGKTLEEFFGFSLIFSLWGAVVAASVVSFPLLYRSARGAFSALEDELQDAAKTLGLGASARFFRVSLPLAKNGIVAGALMALARAMGEFGATLMVAGNIPGKTQTLPLAIFEAVQSGSRSDALLLCLLATIAGGGLLMAAETLTGRSCQ